MGCPNCDCRYCALRHNPDEKIERLRRVALQTEDPHDWAKVLIAKMQAGELSENHIALAAYLGDPAAIITGVERDWRERNTIFEKTEMGCLSEVQDLVERQSWFYGDDENPETNPYHETIVNLKNLICTFQTIDMFYVHKLPTHRIFVVLLLCNFFLQKITQLAAPLDWIEYFKQQLSVLSESWVEFHALPKVRNLQGELSSIVEDSNTAPMRIYAGILLNILKIISDYGLGLPTDKLSIFLIIGPISIAEFYGIELDYGPELYEYLKLQVLSNII